MNEVLKMQDYKKFTCQYRLRHHSRVLAAMQLRPFQFRNGILKIEDDYFKIGTHYFEITLHTAQNKESARIFA